VELELLKEAFGPCCITIHAYMLPKEEFFGISLIISWLPVPLQQQDRRNMVRRKQKW
jgi:hypothetical protein